MSADKLRKPGEKPTGTGKYIEVGPRGGSINKPRIITIEPGDTPMPPTQAPGHKWKKK